ncbi:glycosyltransferase family 2 protein [Bifidobacterium moukalabense]|jgi:glycosyltransferase involved in cell wall biosynthesis|uniref:glycosyltransferase family 2 protein n=1 Tax=Bifidobacterium moukalabense TaxID=1333651 RepID=UPI0010F6E58E|nr:glycosyltransferase family 2 protein [Bifidobacterium moukalabense]
MTRASILLASYNGAEYIKEQLESILNAAGPTDEIIISDDGSTDSTVSIITRMAETDSRIQIIKGPGRGVVKNISSALSFAQGDFIFLADQDDVWLSDKVDTVLNLFDSHPETTCILHDMAIVNSSLEIQNESYFSFRRCRTGVLHNFIKNSYVGAAMAFRNIFMDKILPIPDSAPMHDQWIGLIHELYGKVELCDKQLMLYRRHPGTSTELHHGSISSMFAKRYGLARALIKKD